MIRAVLDTNVLVSGFVRNHPQAPSVLLLDAWRDQRFELIYSEEILAELERTFDDRYFVRRLSPEQREANLRLLNAEATFTELTAAVSGVATHPEDDRILAAAVSASADYLVTGDAKLLQLGNYEGVRIVPPRRFVEILGREPSSKRE